MRIDSRAAKGSRMTHRQISVNKISRPRMTGIFSRERLFARMDHAFERPVVWVSGPGGSGKSTLVASYLDARSLPCIWYQVDAGDADVATFFYYMGLAVKKAAPHRRYPLPLFTSEYQPDITTFARRYFEKLFSRLKPPCVLVLDDYHEVDGASLFHEVVKCALTEVPHGVNVIVIGRQSPPAAMARLCAGKQMSFVGWDELRLIAEETEGIVCLHEKGGEWRQALGQLHDKTQGWVAGLVLFLERGKVEEAEQQHKEGRTPEDIFNYFADELFEKTETRIRDFLLKTALLPTIVPSLAERLAENPDAAHILAELHGTNFFTEKRHDKEILYRFHPLFREYLLSKAEQSYAPPYLAQLKRKASLLLEESGRIDEAASLCIDADDRERLVSMILENAPVLISQGRSRTVLEWLGHLPHSLLERTPYLLFWSGAAFFTVDPVESRTRFMQAFTLFRARHDRTGLFLSWCAVVDTAIHASEYTPMEQWIEVLKDVLKDDPSYPSRELEVRVSLSLFNAVAFGLPNHPDIHAIRDRAFSLVCTEKTLDANLFLSTGLHLIIHFIYQGDFTRGGIVLNLLQESARSKEAPDLVQIMVKAIEAHYAFATCALDACIGKAFDALALAAKSGIHIWDTHLYGHAVAAALAKGDEKVTGELIAKMSAGLGACRSVDRGYYYWLLAWNSALRKNFAEARQFQELALNFATEIGFLAPKAAILINMAEICLELGDIQGAAAYLDQAFPLVQSIDSAYLSFCHSLVESCLHFKCGSEEKGLALLNRGFRMGSECRMENFYFWRPELMTQLCIKALEADIAGDYVSGLIRKRGLMPAEPPVHIEQWPWPFKIHTLGRFAIEIDGKPLEFSGKVQKKPLEMLKALVALGGEESHEGQLADILWPEADGDTARNSFKVTLHRLRELLGIDKALQLQEGRLTMDRRYFWTDAWAYEQMLTSAQLRGEAGEDEEAVRLTKRALALYRGRFLSEDADKPWALSPRKRLHNRFILNVVAVASLHRRANDHKQAIAIYLQGLEIDDLAEEFYQNLMGCYLAAGLRAEAVSTYQRCQKTLAISLGVAPSAKTAAIFAAAMGG